LQKATDGTSIIGGADGPTAIGIIGYDKNQPILLRWKRSLSLWMYRNKRRKVSKKIRPGSHTTEEVFRFMKERYNAYEATTDYPMYEHKKKQVRFSLIQKEMPELFEEDCGMRLLETVDFGDDILRNEWINNIREWTMKREEKMNSLPEDVLRIDYHLFVVDNGDEKIEIEFEDRHGIVGCSWSSAKGNRKKVNQMVKDIHLFYGVSQEDIEQTTERYNALVAMLARKE